MRKLILLFLALLLFSPAFCQFTFSTYHYTMPSGIWADAVATGDFNGDNRKDVVVTSTYPYSVPHDFFYVFLQKPNGILLDTPIQFPYTNSNNFITQMISKDMDHDNLDDIVIIKRDSFFIHHQSITHTIDSNPVGHYAGNGISNFQIADLDNDGNNDIIISSHGQLFDRVFYGTSIADSFIYIDYVLPQLCYDQMKIGRIGVNPELAIIHVTNAGNSGDAFATRIKNNRQQDTTIYFQQPFAITSLIDEIATGDRFGNGIYSLAASYGGNAPSSKILVWDRPDILSTPNITIPVADVPQNIRMADLNCDGKDEIIVAHGVFNEVTVISQNNNVNSFQAYIPNNMNEYAMDIADVSGDGSLDIIIANTYGGLTILRNTTNQVADTIHLTTTRPSFDSISVNNYIDTSIVQDTLQNPLRIRTETTITTHWETDSVFDVYRTNLYIRRCLSDTLRKTDTTTVTTRYITEPYSVSYTYDTLHPAGIINPWETETIKIYPNPFLDGINIDGLASGAIVDVFDDKGAIVLSFVCEQHCFLTKSQLPQGVYQMIVYEQNTVTRKKIVAL